jgi:Protein of unknown function (DUF3095)
MAGAFRYDALPVVADFERVSDPGIYTALPDDWRVGVTDVVDSTEALRAGRYKAVNMAGAAVVSAVMNALDHAPFPFVFGGDGAVLAVPPEAAEPTERAMAATVRFVAEGLGLTLRAGLIEVAAIRAAGHDVRVARYAASPEAVYAMFSGGGAAFAEDELKAGRLTLAPAPPGAKPDLSGLSCRWSPLRSRRGLILSILVLPAEGSDAGAFRRVTREVISIAQEEERAGNPVAIEGPRFALTPGTLVAEAAAPRRGRGAFLARLARIAGEMLVAIGLDRTGHSLGGFDPRRYRMWVARNTDFRKFEDGLRMILDCSPATADRLEAVLAAAEAERIVDYGLHRQNAALMTCIVPSPFRDDHLHFLDGAGGGYALSALALKTRLAARQIPAAA